MKAEGDVAVLDIPPIPTVASPENLTEDTLDEELFTHPAARPFDCGQDRTRAMTCGRMRTVPDDPAEPPYAQCSRTLGSVNHQMTIGQHTSGATLDTALTALYRLHHGNREHGEEGEEKSCCYSQCVDVASLSASEADPPPHATRLECMASMRRGTRHPAPGRADCPVAVNFGSGQEEGLAASFHDEDSKWRTRRARERTGFERLSLCCYRVMAPTQMAIPGRALRAATGEVIVALPEMTGAWAQDFSTLEVASLAPGLREVIARRWARDAALEHASVASFCRLSLQLLACGAPPDLVAGAQQSALDEVGHARLCYGLASRYALTPIGPGHLPPALPVTSDVVALATETFRDGCVGETVAAVMASQCATACERSPVRQALLQIATEEERHAELAWRILKWALRFEGVRPALLMELGRLRAEPSEHAVPSSAPDEDALARHGLLGEVVAVNIRKEVVRQLVRPCAQALLATA